MRKTWIILATIAAVTLVAYFSLPIRFFTEDVFPLTHKARVIAYDDLVDGGSSQVSFQMVDSSVIDFACTLGGGEDSPAWCGMLIDLRIRDAVVDDKNVELNRDWTFVDSVIFELESSGTSEVLAKIWTLDPQVTDTNVARSYRLLMKELPLTSGRQRISIPMEQFYTPEFWFKDNHVDTTLVDRHQEAVVRLEIAPGWNQPRGQKFALKIHRITAKGLSNATFGGVLFVMLILTIVAVGRRHSVSHQESSEKDGGDHA